MEFKKMKSYKYFILEKNLWTGTEQITKNQAKEVFKQFCTEVDLENDTKIIRVVDNIKQKCFLIDPSKYERRSANTLNYYTLVLNNAPNWKEYPKRKLICAIGNNYWIDDEFVTEEEAFRIIPFDGSKWGVCSKYDIWDSFSYLESMGMCPTDDFNYILNNMIDAETYEEMMVELDKLPPVFSDFPNKLDLYFSKHPDMLKSEAVLDLLDPNKNGFRLVDYKSLAKFSPKSNNEVWTDSKCLMVPLTSNF